MDGHGGLSRRNIGRGVHILEGHACELGATDADRSIVGCVSRGWRWSVLGRGVIPKPEKRNTVVRLDIAS